MGKTEGSNQGETKMMETEMIDKLYLELSQIATAKTQKEKVLENYLYEVLKAWQTDGVKDEKGHKQLFNRAWCKVQSLEPEPVIYYPTSKSSTNSDFGVFTS